MANNQLVSVVDYLRIGSRVNDEHLNKIRDLYKHLHTQISDNIDEQDQPNETIITQIAHDLNIRSDTDESRQYLHDCVRYEDINNARLVLESTLAGSIQPSDEDISHGSVVSHIASPRPSSSTHVTENITILDKISCILNIKMMIPEIQTFIHSFLLQKVNKLKQSDTSVIDITTSKIYDEQFILPCGCLLDLFIRQQLHEQGPIPSFSYRNSIHLRLVEPVSLTDNFSTWQYDHWHGLFDLILKPYDNKTRFPARWCLSDDTQIYCYLSNNDVAEGTSSSSVNDKPRTASLNVFIHDICIRENNDLETAWLRALHKEDILRFEDLANLSQSEWDKIQQLSMQAKKIIKTAVDKERVSVVSERYRRKQINSDNHENNDDDILQTNTQEDSFYSHSEMLANLHLIKLFIWHTLRNNINIQQYGALPKLESECLDAAFNEMRNGGFADDDLFPKIQEFFYPLTISEYEIRTKRQISSNEHHAYVIQRDQLYIDIKRLTNNVNELAASFGDLQNQYDLLKEQLKNARIIYTRERTAIISKINNGQQQQQHIHAQALQQRERKWQQTHADLSKQLNNVDQLKREAAKKQSESEKELDEYKKNVKSIEKELVRPRKHIDKELVKPARGLIMYGPPGTGKSQIMSQLAKKLGVFMVGPPLAAGELNRPLVGESERILVDLCTRCNRVPYAMCCISIDEIDSLAPKRDNDSSEGKIDKISVLLSLIEGIKDVPNLMILCATNRLHMMDEAFLRRMSGKFFVGRPSSNARLSILENIPEWALKLELINRLAIATTNFSGAAVKALTRAITVRAMVAQRTERTYQIGHLEALKIADRTAQQYQIYIGSETLPRLLSRNLNTASEHHIQELLNNINYTGRIVIDLHSGYVRIEIRRENRSTNTNSLSIDEQALKSNEINVQTLLERLSIYGQNRNVQLLQLIDLNLLASQSAYDEKKVFETLKDRYDECSAYSRSMIIYDLDALAGVNKSESDSNMGRSMSSSVVNANIYTYIRARFRDCALEEQQENADQIERWAVAIIREPFLLRQFCTDVQFARTRQEEDEDELVKQKSEVRLKCVKCKDFYIENENKMGNCVYHDGFVYDNSATDLVIYKQSDVIKWLHQLECEIINDPDQRDKLERQKSKFKWICCDIVFTNGNTGGCKKGKHEFNVDSNNDNDLKQRYANGRADRLEQKTIDKWEEICRFNEEYNEKWLMLLNSR